MRMLWRPISRYQHPSEAAVRAPGLLAFWTGIFPDSTSNPDPKECDFEDWAENASIGLSLAHTGIEHEIIPDQSFRGRISGEGGGGLSVPHGECAYMFGGWQKADSLFPMVPDRALHLVGCGPDDKAYVSRYARSETFRRHAGRPMVIAGGDVGGEGGIEAALKTIAETGASKVFVKTLHKEFANLYDLKSKDGRHYSATFAGCEDMDYIPVRHKGSREVLLVQGAIRPTFEYRMIVIDHVVATGAGCVERLVPCDATGEFDLRMERVRGSGEIEERPDVLDRYLDFAGLFVNEYCEEAERFRAAADGRPEGQGRWPLCYSLDLCIDADTGNVVPVELNAAQGFGCYASETDLYVRAVDRMLREETFRRLALGLTQVED